MRPAFTVSQTSTSLRGRAIAGAEDRQRMIPDSTGAVSNSRSSASVPVGSSHRLLPFGPQGRRRTGAA